MDTPSQKRLDKIVYALIAFLLGGAVYLGSLLSSSAWPILIWVTIVVLMAIALIGGWIRRRLGKTTPSA